MRGGALRGGGLIIEFCKRFAALDTPARGELWFMFETALRGDLATRFARDLLRRGVIKASADLPERTGRETEARAAGSEGSEATSR